eukprot:3545426-Prymnesium_polylepis.1
MLVSYDDSDVDESDAEPDLSLPSSCLPAIAQHDSASNDSDEEPAATPAVAPTPIVELVAASSTSVLPSADDFDALGADAGAFLSTALTVKPASRLDLRPPAAASAHAEEPVAESKVQGPRARPIWSFAEEKFGKRKAESTQESRKHAGKVKGEFKKRSESSRGGERAPVRWD